MIKLVAKWVAFVDLFFDSVLKLINAFCDNSSSGSSFFTTSTFTSVFTIGSESKIFDFGWGIGCGGGSNLILDKSWTPPCPDSEFSAKGSNLAAFEESLLKYQKGYQYFASLLKYSDFLLQN